MRIAKTDSFHLHLVITSDRDLDRIEVKNTCSQPYQSVLDSKPTHIVWE